MLPPLDIAIAGTRGVPANYSGFETFAEELGARLVSRGHSVTVYGREHYVGPERRAHRGISVRPLPSLRGKHLETPSATLISALAALRARHDVVLVCNAANAFALPLFRAAGAATVMNVDGVDRLRRKWGRAGRIWYWLGERLALRFSNQLVVDAECLHSYWEETHGISLPVIPYGGEREAPEEHPILAELGLEPGRYVLTVGRLEPENNALAVVEAYARVPGELPLVVLGDAPYADDYKAQVRAAAGPRVLLPGGIYGEGYVALQRKAACYVAAGEVGGIHPALVEAMTFGGPIVANEVVEHREALGKGGLYYRDEAGLAAAITRVLTEPGLGDMLRERARARAATRYRWDAVTERYEALFRELARGRKRS